MRVSHTQESPRNSTVSREESDDERVTVLIIEPEATRPKPSYWTALYLGLGLVACATILCVSSSRAKASTLIPFHQDSAEGCLDFDECKEAEQSTTDGPKRALSIDDLTDKQCKAIFDSYILSDKIREDLKYEEGKEVDIRLSQPWVEGMKQAMANHASKVLRHLYQEFETLTTIQMGIYLYKISRYGGSANGKLRHYTKRISKRFSRTLFSFIVHDKEMRRYLAYRGLRSQMNNGKWGTIVCYFGDNLSHQPWRWLNDEDNMLSFVKSYGQQGTWFTVWSAQTKDYNGTAASSFKQYNPYSKFFGEMEHILQAGGL